MSKSFKKAFRSSGNFKKLPDVHKLNLVEAASRAIVETKRRDTLEEASDTPLPDSQIVAGHNGDLVSQAVRDMLASFNKEFAKEQRAAIERLTHDSFYGLPGSTRTNDRQDDFSSVVDAQVSDDDNDLPRNDSAIKILPESFDAFGDLAEPVKEALRQCPSFAQLSINGQCEVVVAALPHIDTFRLATQTALPKPSSSRNTPKSSVSKILRSRQKKK